jgi:hypothetical protein
VDAGVLSAILRRGGGFKTQGGLFDGADGEKIKVIQQVSVFGVPVRDLTRPGRVVFHVHGARDAQDPGEIHGLGISPVLLAVDFDGKELHESLVDGLDSPKIVSFGSFLEEPVNLYSPSGLDDDRRLPREFSKPLSGSLRVHHATLMPLAIGHEEVELDPDDPGEKRIVLGTAVLEDRLAVDADSTGGSGPLLPAKADAHVDVRSLVVIDGGRDEGVHGARVEPRETLDAGGFADCRELRVPLAIPPDGFQKLSRRHESH